MTITRIMTCGVERSAVHRRPLGWLLAALLIAAPLVVGQGQTDPYKIWDWKMPGELYKQLNHIHRAQLDKAANLFQRGFDITRHYAWHNVPEKQRQAVQYFKAAALEWKKVRVQIGDSLSDSALAYVIFMQANSQHYALNRNQAIRTYTEVLDYFPNEIWVAVPALFFRAQAQFENGDERAGYKSLQAIAEDADYLKHPLAAGALRRLADNHWANQQFDQAAHTWLIAWENYHKANAPEAANAAKKLKAYYLIEQKFDALEQFLARIVQANRKTALPDALLGAFAQARSGLQPQSVWDSWYYKRFHNESKARMLMAEHRKAIYQWFAGKQAFFTQAGRLWDYHQALLEFVLNHKTADPAPLIQQLTDALRAMSNQPDVAVDRGGTLISELARHRMRDQASTVFGYLSGIVRGAKISADRKQALAASLVNRLAYHGMADEARSLLDLYIDGAKALWAEYAIAERTGDWSAGLKVLDQIEALDQPNDLRAARQKRAWIYQYQTREYDKAIKVYRQLADPPATLWAIQSCQRASKQTPQALATLTEIASMFPDQAPKAVYTKAEYYREDGQHKLAVALYRQILQRFKKSPQSSQAHQRLEDYGIKTGGGVINPLD